MNAKKDNLVQNQTAQADKIVSYMILFLWGFGMLISFHYDTWMLGMGMGSVLLVIFLIAVKAFPQKLISRLIGASVMAFYMVQYLAQLQGLYEMHFWFFIMPMFLITYQDWRVFIPFAAIIVVHHLLIFILVRQGQEEYLIYFINMNTLTNMTFLYHIGLAVLGVVSAGTVSFRLNKETRNRYQNARQLELQLQEMESVALNIKSVASTITNEDSEANLGKSVSVSLANLESEFTNITDNILKEINTVVNTAALEGDLSSRMNEEDKYLIWKELSHSINTLLESFSNPVIRINQMADQLSKGILTDHIEVEAKGEIKNLFDNMNIALNNLRSLLQEVSIGIFSIEDATSEMLYSSSEMDTNTNEIANAIAKMSSGAHEQLNAIERTSQILESVMSGSKEIQLDVEKINHAAQEGFKSSETGKKVVQLVVEDIKQIEEFSNKTSDSIQLLSKRSKEIAATLSVITEIASQTNLLALNAAIEAAQAGENGRGFAVVADEIKKLAENSKKSTGEIEEIIRVVLHDTEQAALTMGEMKKRVESGVQSTQKTNEMFDILSGGTKKTLNISQNILTSTTSQSQKIKEVVGQMESVIMISEQTATGTEEVASSAGQLSSGMKEFNERSDTLNEMGKKLKNGIKKFKLEH